MSKRYANRARVFFDVFNKPRMPNGGDDDNAAWLIWRNGGERNGTVYVGMQTIVTAIRRNAQDNLIIVEGLAGGEDIQLLQSYTLAGSNVVYAVRPYLNATYHANPTQWDNWFGNAAATGSFPSMAVEWNEYQDAKDPECFPGADKIVPTFLAYLHEKGIGLIAYGLVPGTLMRGWDYTKTTKFDISPYVCEPSTTSFPNIDPRAQGNWCWNTCGRTQGPSNTAVDLGLIMLMLFGPPAGVVFFGGTGGLGLVALSHQIHHRRWVMSCHVLLSGLIRRLTSATVSVMRGGVVGGSSSALVGASGGSVSRSSWKLTWRSPTT